VATPDVCHRRTRLNSVTVGEGRGKVGGRYFQRRQAPNPVRVSAAGAGQTEQIHRKMPIRRVGKVDRVLWTTRIFPVGIPEIARFFRRISGGSADGVIIIGVAAPIFNTRRFRPPFSS